MPLTGASAELVAFVSTSATALSAGQLAKQTDISFGYGRFQRAELTAVIGRPMLALGTNASGTTVGGCPSGYGFGTEDATCITLSPNSTTTPFQVGSSAVATIAGTQYKLSSIANLAACGFDPTATTGLIAVAVSETRSILVQGEKPSTAEFGVSFATCLLTPTTPVNGVPRFQASPL